jgi:hypothetical protein
MTDSQYLEQMNQKIDALYQDFKVHETQLQTAQAKALAETAAEVLGGIRRAFNLFLTKSKEPWSV